MTEDWHIVERQPAPFGYNRQEREKKLDKKYPEGWREAHRFVDKIIPKKLALQICEDAYFLYLREQRDLLGRLIDEARDVIEAAEGDVESSIFYTRQQGKERFHYADIAVRRAMIRLGRSFNGERLIIVARPPIPSQQVKDSIPELSPYNVPFHIPDEIIKPESKNGWNPDSVEAFYQSNRVIIARTHNSTETMEKDEGENG